MRNPGSIAEPRGVAFICSALLLVAMPVLFFGQDRLSLQQRQKLATVPKALPGDLLVQLRAFGGRFDAAGKEESVFMGLLQTEFEEPKPITVVHQISGMVKIEGRREQKAVSFDGDFLWGSLDGLDEALIETFVMDTVEGLIHSARSGGAVRLAGRRFGPDSRTRPKDYKGPYYDIYEVLARVRSHTDGQLRMKRYYFDSDTGFLLSTRYVDPTVSKGLAVETRFGDWRQVAGSSYPGLVERYEDGRRVFSFTVSTATGRQAQDAVNFR